MISSSDRHMSLVNPKALLPEEEDAVLSPRERLEILCDPDSVHVIRSYVTSTSLGAEAAEGDGVVAASGSIVGGPVCCYAEDGRFVGGSVGEAHAETIVQCLRLAHEAKVPV